MDYEKRKRLIVNTAYGAVIFSLVYVAVQYGLKLIMPFLLGFIIAAGLRRPALWISGKWKLPVKPVALALAAVFYCTAGLLAAFAGLKILSALVDLLPKLPELYTNTVEPTLAGAFAVIEDEISRMDPELMKELQTLFNQFNQSVGEMITGMSVQALGAISASATSLPGLFIKALLMIISTFFIAADYDLLAGFAARQFTGQTGRFMVRIRQYVVGTLFVCIRSYAIIMSITFFELSLGLSLIGIKNAVLIAFCIAVFDILDVYKSQELDNIGLGAQQLAGVDLHHRAVSQLLIDIILKRRQRQMDGAVSYTHLEVHFMKLAVVCANGKEGKLIVEEALARGLDVTAVAVSYTHLDVYKRQFL